VVLTIREIRLHRQHDSKGALILPDGRLIALFSQLSAFTASGRGVGFLEYGVGPLSGAWSDFATLQEAAEWALKGVHAAD
jgi:hypothetical protein